MSIIGNTVKPSATSTICNTIPLHWLVADYKLTGTAEDDLNNFNGSESSATYTYDNDRGIVYSGSGNITIPNTSGLSCTYWENSGTDWVFTYSETIPTTLTTNMYSNLVCYNKTLSSSDQLFVQNLQESIHNIPIDNGLIAYYPLDGNSLDNAISQADGTDSGVSYVYASEMDKVVVNTVDKQYISTDFGGVPIYKAPITICGWVKGDMYILVGATTSALTSGRVWVYLSSVSNVYGLDVYQGTGLIDTSKTLDENTWYFVTLTSDESGRKLYLDAEMTLADSVTVANDSTAEYGYSYYIGNHHWTVANSNKLDGDISNLRIYNRALSQAEIEAIYEYEKPNSTVCLPDITVDQVDPFGDGSGVALYKLDGDATDAGGNYDGTATNVTYSDGVFGKAGVFNGSSSQLQIPTNTFNADVPYTVSGWIKRNASGEVCNLAWFTNGTSQTSITVNDTGFYINHKYLTNRGNSESPATAYTDGQFHLYTAVFDGTNGYCYVDGILDDSFLLSPKNTSGQIIDIGGSLIYGSTRYYYSVSGLDQVRIFNKALTQEEVTILYNERKE